MYNSISEEEEAKTFYSDGSNYMTFCSFFWKVVFKLTNDFYGLNRSSSDWAKKLFGQTFTK